LPVAVLLEKDSLIHGQRFVVVESLQEIVAGK